MKKKASVSLIILTRNEEMHLKRCVDSARNIASDIIVVDSFSSDKTESIAKECGAEFVQHQFLNQADQFNWALDNLEINGDWILRLDADEFLTEELSDEILERLENIPENISGFSIKRRVHFMGRWIRHGGYYPSWFVRLFKKGKGRYEVREVDEHVVINDGEIQNLKNDFVDSNKQNLEWWIGKQNNHSSREVSALINKSKDKELKPSLFAGQAERRRWLKERLFMSSPKFMRSFLYFFYRYFLRLGFLDGVEGLIFHFLTAFWYRFLIDAKLFEYQKAIKNNNK
ncbi:MAG: glycosyltransferase family 2 protein [bacterium]